MHVVGRGGESGLENEPESEREGSLPTGKFGQYLARDGSVGAPMGIDLGRPHAGLVVGKRGAGKSHTLGVLAEATARVSDVATVVVDPMGAFSGLATEAERGVDRVPAERLPAGRGEALVVVDATESTHTVRVRERHTPHGGDTPGASDVVTGSDVARETERRERTNGEV